MVLSFLFRGTGGPLFPFSFCLASVSVKIWWDECLVDHQDSCRGTSGPLFSFSLYGWSGSLLVWASGPVR